MRLYDFGRRIQSVPFCAVVALTLGSVPTLSCAAELKARETSLNKVPADTEAYGAWLRMGETIETIGKSRAWNSLKNDPMVQQFLKKVQEKYEMDDGEWAQVKRFFAEPANNGLPSLAADLLANEVFVYAGSGWTDLLLLGQELVGMRSARAYQKFLTPEADDSSRARIRIALQTLSENAKRLRIPDLVIGFKVSEPATATAQLKRLDSILSARLKDTPLKGRSERIRVEGDEFLLLKLDGSLLPWELLPLAEYEDRPNEFAPLTDHIKKMTLNIAVGVRQGYLLVALGESSEQLKLFGGNGPKLSDRAEFKPLQKFADRPLTTIGYTSAKFRQVFATAPEDIAGFAELAKAGLKQLDLPAELTAQVSKDLDLLAASLGRGLRRPGSEANFSFRTAQGWESYSYDYTDSERSEARPLTLLDHLGGRPLLAVAWRSDTKIEDYRAWVKWVAVFGEHAEKIVALKVPDADEPLKKWRDHFLPLLREASDITEKLWMPALADGQEGIVVDAKWSSKQWHGALPESEAPLPMLEFGIIAGVTDAVRLQKALEGFRLLANKVIAKAAAEFPGIVPEFEIPVPQIERRGGNTFAHYPIPEALGLDKQFRPTGGLSKSVAALTLSREHAERLLSATPLETGSTMLKSPVQPLDSMFYLNWGATMDAAEPWVTFLVRKYGEDESAGQVAQQVVRCLKLFRSYTSATYREAGATITHSEAIFRDFAPEAKKPSGRP